MHIFMLLYVVRPTFLILNNKVANYFGILFKSSKWVIILIINIILLNLLGLLPYNITISLYIWVTFLVALILWSLFSIRFFFKSTGNAIGHLLPLGSPIFLWNFLIILEVLRQCIRPVTLSLRLSCNLIAGHILLSLTINLSNILTYFLLIILVVFERGVNIIQAFVFNILIIIYKKERIISNN